MWQGRIFIEKDDIEEERETHGLESVVEYLSYLIFTETRNQALSVVLAIDKHRILKIRIPRGVQGVRSVLTGPHLPDSFHCTGIHCS